MNIATSQGSMTLNPDARPSIDDMNDIIASVTRNDDAGAQFQRLCDASTAFPSTLTNAEFLAACEKWVSAEVQ